MTLLDPVEAPTTVNSVDTSTTLPGTETTTEALTQNDDIPDAVAAALQSQEPDLGLDIEADTQDDIASDIDTDTQDDITSDIDTDVQDDSSDELSSTTETSKLSSFSSSLSDVIEITDLYFINKGGRAAQASLVQECKRPKRGHRMPLRGWWSQPWIKENIVIL